MTLSERIQLIDSMIRENPDFTIRDYLDLVKDIESIKAAATYTPVIPIIRSMKVRKGEVAIKTIAPFIPPSKKLYDF